MIVKTKKKNPQGVQKLETYGGLKEVIIKEDIFEPGNNLIEVCFKGEISSGIVELSVDEIDKINLELEKSRKRISKSVKVMKFKK